MAPRIPVWQWIVGLVGGLLVIVVVGGWFAWRKTADLMQARIQANPVVAEHVGTIRDLAIDAEAVSRIGQPGRLVFTVVGSKGRGVLAFEVDTAQANGNLIRRGTLTLDGGRVFPLVPDSAGTLPTDLSKPLPPPPSGKPLSPAAAPAP